MLLRLLALSCCLSLSLAAQPPTAANPADLDLQVQKAQLAFERAELDRDKMKQALEVVTSEAARKSMTEELASLEKVVETRKAELASLRLRQREVDLNRRERALQQSEAPPVAPVKPAVATTPRKDEFEGIDPSKPGDEDYVEIPEFKISDKLRETLKKAESGDANAQYEAGYAYDYGIGSGRDYRKSMHWYRKAADQGHGNGTEGVAWLHYWGQGTPVAKSEAAKWFARCADQGIQSCVRGLALLTRSGEGGFPADPKKAQRMLDQVSKSLQAKATAGDAKAALSVAFLFADQGDAKLEAKWHKVAATLNSAEGAFQLALFLIRANRSKEAIPYLQQAMNLEHVGAINEIGLLTKKGDGVGNDEKAARLYVQAAEMGDITAMAYAGISLTEGRWTRTDYGDGKRWLRLASAFGNTTAQRFLAVSYYKTDPRRRYWLRKAADSGDAEAMADLSASYGYVLGQGLNYANNRLAMEWARKGQAAGSQRAARMVKDFEEAGRAKLVPSGPGFWERATQITGAINEGLAQANANAGNRPTPTTRYPTTPTPTRTATTTCNNWSPRLERLLASELDPQFANTLRNQKSNPNYLADLVAKSGGPAAARRLIQEQIAEYERAIRSQGNETALGHAEVRDRYQRSIEYNSALLDLVGTCAP